MALLGPLHNRASFARLCLALTNLYHVGGGTRARVAPDIDPVASRPDFDIIQHVVELYSYLLPKLLLHIIHTHNHDVFLLRAGTSNSNLRCSPAHHNRMREVTTHIQLAKLNDSITITQHRHPTLLQQLLCINQTSQGWYASDSPEPPAHLVRGQLRTFLAVSRVHDATRFLGK